MPILQQLCAHAVIATMALGGMGCLCPAEAVTSQAVSPATSRAAVAHTAHGHEGAHAVDAETDAGCGHEQCGPDCTRVSAAAAKSKALKSTAPGKDAPTLDDAAFLPAGFAAWPAASRRRGRPAVSFTMPVRLQDSPVRRFDRLLD